MENYLSKRKHSTKQCCSHLRGIFLWCWSRNIILLLTFVSLTLLIVYYAAHLLPIQQHVYFSRFTHRNIPESSTPPPSLNGSRKVIQDPVPTNEELEKTLDWVESGGHHSPGYKTKDRVAILVPYRNRPKHIPLFLINMHPFLRNQPIEYTIFVVEQYGNDTFNKGALVNGGYKEARKIKEFDCIIINDVDHIPEFYKNLYTCPEQPRHMAQGIRIFNASLDFNSIFGGVIAMKNEHYELINGFSNKYWGWGGEDDDMYYRVLNQKLKITKYPHDIAWYTMLKHKKAEPNPKRLGILKDRAKYYKTSGLNDVNYTVIKIEEKKLYTHILLDILRPDAITTTTATTIVTTTARTTATTRKVSTTIVTAATTEAVSKNITESN